MAGDRGLAFVFIGLIGVSAFWVSNQHRIEPRTAHARAAQIDSTIHESSMTVPLKAVMSDGDTDEAWHVLGRHGQGRGGAAMLVYPELSGPVADALSRFRERLRLVAETQVPPPVD